MPATPRLRHTSTDGRSDSRSATLRAQVGAEQLAAFEIVKCHGEPFRVAVDAHGPEVLLALRRWPVLLHPRGNADVAHVRAEGAVDLAGAERARVDRPGHELPERREIAERRTRRIVVDGRGV